MPILPALAGVSALLFCKGSDENLAQKDALDTIADEIVNAIDKQLSNASFDKSSTGVITAHNGNVYTVQAFGSTYNVTSDKTFSIGQAVIVTALQGNVSHIVLSEGNSDIQLSSGFTVNQLSENFVDFTDQLGVNEDLIQQQIDGSITTWYYNGTPSATTYPASDWSTTEAKESHLNDIYFDRDTKYCYRWLKKNETYQWTIISDQSTVNAIAAAGEALDTADNKRRVFYVTPSPPYDVGDLWVEGKDGDIWRCCKARGILDIYYTSDWELASKYTDDSRADEVEENTNKWIKETYSSDYQNTQTELSSIKTYNKKVGDYLGNDLEETTLESKLQQIAEGVTSDVKKVYVTQETYKTTVESLTNLTQKSDEISATVSEYTTLTDKINGDYVSGDSVRTKFAMNKKDITLEANYGTITFRGGSLVIDTTGFKLDAKGNATFAGNITGGSININNRKFYMNDKGSIGVYGNLNGTTGLWKGQTARVRYKRSATDARLLWFVNGVFVGDTNTKWYAGDENVNVWNGNG